MVAYVIGSLFLSIFSFSCTAILHCFIMAEDTGSNVESPESLKPFLEKNDDHKSGKKETEMTEKKGDDKPDDKKDEAPAANDVSWTILLIKKELRYKTYNIFTL